MNESIVEIGIKLNNDFEYYNNLLINNGLKNNFNAITHDIYYTNKNLDGLTENEMKNSCIRLRNVQLFNKNNDTYKIENNILDSINIKNISNKELEMFEKELDNLGFKKIFDTKKIDHHYCKDEMNSKVQLQEIDGIGLLVYFDNSDYYKYPLDVQRKMLIDELNTYGFNIDYEELGLDKLRTLYYKKEMYSNNQNS